MTVVVVPIANIKIESRLYWQIGSNVTGQIEGHQRGPRLILHTENPQIRWCPKHIRYTKKTIFSLSTTMRANSRSVEVRVLAMYDTLS